MAEDKIKIGITGQSGFIGSHLFNTLSLYPAKFQLIPFEDAFFQDEKELCTFVSQCDAIVHLAALNRHNDPDLIYKTNIGLVQQLIGAMKSTHSSPDVFFSSSTQEERDNLYGKSKKEGRRLLENWAKEQNATFIGLVIPNVYGPFGNPYYNSVVATFCHQLTHDEQPKIDVDGEIKLIYVGELVELIIGRISEKHDAGYISQCFVPHTVTIKVSKLLDKLECVKDKYLSKGIIPDIGNAFDRNLFNTFVCFIDHKRFFPFQLKKNTDERGSFVETIKLTNGGQVSFSTTKPGITRGNHFHTRKAERFTVIKGKALIGLRKIGTNEVLSFELDGDKPSFVDMPIWHTHNIKNIGEEELYTIFWISELYDGGDPDTFYEEV